jgi:hypothetical protein
VEHEDAPTDAGDVRAPDGAIGPAGRLVEHLHGSRLPAGHVGIAGGRRQPPGPLGAGRRQARGALQGGGRSARGTARPRPQADVLQRGGELLVLPHGRAGQVPRAGVPRADVRERPVRGPALGLGSAVVDRRAQERMGEGQPLAGQDDHAGALGRLERRRIGTRPEARHGVEDGLQPRGVARGGDEQGLQRRGGKGHDAPGERPLERRPERQRGLDGGAPRALRRIEHPGDLEQRERDAARRLDQHVRDGSREVVVRGPEQLAGGARIERADLQGRDRRRVHVPLGRGPARQQHRHTFAAQPARGEQERVHRRAVDPLRVVHGEEDGRSLGEQREQAQDRRPHGEAVAGRPRTARERGLERPPPAARAVAGRPRRDRRTARPGRRTAGRPPTRSRGW